MSQRTPGTQTVDTAETVNEIIVQYPAAVSVFNAFGIDACCGGDASVEEAARRDGANIHALIDALQRLITQAGDAE